nr:MAG TPA: hypothetical protein [Caudoviricetes sp.]
MTFWQLAYSRKWVTADQLRLAVKTEKNPYGQITADEFKTISGENFADA